MVYELENKNLGCSGSQGRGPLHFHEFPLGIWKKSKEKQKANSLDVTLK
jgi:hypothetical protein